MPGGAVKRRVVRATMGKRAAFLSPPDLHRLDWACRPIFRAFGTPPYLVGSAMSRPDYRDVDLRLILDDERFERMFAGEQELVLLLNVALSDLIERSAGQRAPIDFQIQSMTEANVPEHGVRNPMGLRHG
jgi:hypothetical protein